MDFQVILQEKIVWEKYPQTSWFQLKEDDVVADKFPEWELIPLERRQKKTKGQKWWDWFCCLCTDAPDGGAEFVNALEDTSVYYLVKREEECLLVNVGKETLTAWAISAKLAEDKKIEFGKNLFYKTKRKVNGNGRKE